MTKTKIETVARTRTRTDSASGTADTEEGRGAASADPEPPVPSWWRLIASWRDWHLPTKLAAVTLVPIIFAIVLGAMQIADQVDRADSYRRVDRLVAVNEQLRALVAALQRERNAGTGLLAAGSASLTTELADEQQGANAARNGLARAARRATFDHEIAAARYAEVSARLDELPTLRAQLLAGQLDATVALASYTEIIAALLGFDRTTAAQAIDPELAATAGALHDLEAAKEEVQYQQALVGVGIARGSLPAAELDALGASQARFADRFADFHAVASPGQLREFAHTVTGPGVEARANLINQVTSAGAGVPVPTTAAAWNAAADFTSGRISGVAAALGSQLHDRSAALQDEASDGAGLASVILLVALVVAVAVMFIVGRHLMRSLNLLRRSALDVAEHGLPDAVERIRHSGDAAEPVVEPVPVRSKDEVGQVARAFEAVHRQALRLAIEQAGLRARYSDVFVNLSRRSQGLVQRQLHLIERLERDEEDAEQLDTLFQLDHLATRMRRNNENLMVLSGSELGRRSHRPAALADLLRASVSEIEQYQRVVILPPPAVLIVGYAVGDLIRLTAELLDNATAFSAPSTKVTIASHCFEDGSVCIAILDEGIGMSELELAAANAKLADSATIDVSTSRRMGLFVVGRLASRHGIEVQLHGGREIAGVRATITVPAELVTSNVAEAHTAAIPVNPITVAIDPVTGALSPNGARSPNGSAPDPLPRRMRPTNGTPSTDIARRLLGEEDTKEVATPPAATPPATPATGEGLPLPRRLPGAGRIPDPTKPPGLPLPGSSPGLFTPTEESVEETTPIFDEMVSAWFRAISSDGDAEGKRSEEEQWKFAADAGFVAAKAVSTSEPAGFTTSGLPRRNPQQHLVPGSAQAVSASGASPKNAAPPVAAPVAPPDRDAEEMRGRLTSYRDGVSRARSHRNGKDMNGTPKLDPPSTPDRTAGGLPRRPLRPSPDTGNGAPPQVDRAEELRGRLGNFQRGLSRGRQSLADRTSPNGLRDGQQDVLASGASPREHRTMKRESE